MVKSAGGVVEGLPRERRAVGRCQVDGMPHRPASCPPGEGVAHPRTPAARVQRDMYICNTAAWLLTSRPKATAQNPSVS